MHTLDSCGQKLPVKTVQYIVATVRLLVVQTRRWLPPASLGGFNNSTPDQASAGLVLAESNSSASMTGSAFAFVNCSYILRSTEYSVEYLVGQGEERSPESKNRTKYNYYGEKYKSSGWARFSRLLGQSDDMVR